MFKLILLFILFTIFSINYFFGYLRTIPTFKLISHFNFYEYLLDKFDDRNGYFTGLDYKTLDNDKNYIIDISGGVLKLDLKYLSKDSDKLLLYVPIFILHTGDNILSSGDSLFSGLKIKKDFYGYEQYISGGNDYIDIGSSIESGNVIEQTLYLGNFYSYCSLTGTKRIDAYLYDRYLEWNKSGNYKEEDLVDNTYVCETGTNIGEYTKNVCVSWYWWGGCRSYETRTYQSCKCSDKGEYKICDTETDINLNPDGKSCSNTDNKCIDYYTGSVNLNKTNCSLSGSLGVGEKSKYFLIR